MLGMHLRVWLIALCFAAVAICPRASMAQTQVASQGKTVTTGAAGQQILFRDKTGISAGADTTVTVTSASCDAKTGAGNIVIDVAKGAFRYVTGDTAGSHTIKAPLSTVGVRGTVIEGYIDPKTGVEVWVLIEGAFEVCTSPSVCQNVTAPGTYVVVSPNGSISAPDAVPPPVRCTGTGCGN